MRKMEQVMYKQILSAIYIMAFSIILRRNKANCLEMYEIGFRSITSFPSSGWTSVYWVLVDRFNTGSLILGRNHWPNPPQNKEGCIVQFNMNCLDTKKTLYGSCERSGAAHFYDDNHTYIPEYGYQTEENEILFVDRDSCARKASPVDGSITTVIGIGNCGSGTLDLDHYGTDRRVYGMTYIDKKQMWVFALPTQIMLYSKDGSQRRQLGVIQEVTNLFDLEFGTLSSDGMIVYTKLGYGITAFDLTGVTVTRGSFLVNHIVSYPGTEDDPDSSAMFTDGMSQPEDSLSVDIGYVSPHPFNKNILIVADAFTSKIMLIDTSNGEKAMFCQKSTNNQMADGDDDSCTVARAIHAIWVDNSTAMILDRYIPRIINFYLEEDDCDSDPCLNGGTCTDTYADFECSCLPDWTGTDCGTNANTCESDDQCSGLKVEAVCEGAPKTCRPICLNSMYCAQGVCTALTRTTGEAINVCMPQCSASTASCDCELGTVCIAQRCLMLCDPADTDNTLCAEIGQKCNPHTHHCSELCSEDSDCGPSLGILSACFVSQRLCVVACLGDADCSSSAYNCHQGMCLNSDPGDITCLTENDCPGSAVCDESDGLCISPTDRRTDCQTMMDCGTMAFCHTEGYCERVANLAAPCTDSDDCGHYEECLEGVCISQQDETGLVAAGWSVCSRCGGESVSHQSVCDTEVCQCTSNTTQWYGGVRCDIKETDIYTGQWIQPPGPWPDCDDTEDCSGFQCIYSNCFLICSNDGQCPYNHYCEANLCVRSCVEGGSLVFACSTSQTCYDNRCRMTCYSEYDCFDHQRCLNELCIPMCETDKECREGHVCSGGVCQAICKVNDDCTGDLICNGGVCTQTCTVSSQADVCGDRFKCVLGVCSKPCVSDRGCLRGQLCFGGFCTQHCNEDSDCTMPDGECTVDNICTVQCSDDNTDSCGENDWTCESDLCYKTCLSSPADCHVTQICTQWKECIRNVGGDCEIDLDCNPHHLYRYKTCEDNECVDIFHTFQNCNSSEECGSFALCVDGICMWPPALTDTRCVEGQCLSETDMAYNPPRAPSPRLIHCNSTGGTSEGDSLCQQYITSALCTENVCLCPDGHQRLYGICVPFIKTCSPEINCPEGSLCVDGQCQVVCSESDDCADGLMCTAGGVCGFPCKGVDKLCPHGTVCHRGNCEQACDPISDRYERRRGNGSQTCFDGICRQTETNNDLCPSNTFLRKTVCVSRCNSDSQCPDICALGGCSSRCSSSKLCPHGYVCMGRRCYVTCTEDTSETDCEGQGWEFSCRHGLYPSYNKLGICLYVLGKPFITPKDITSVRALFGADLHQGVSLEGTDVISDTGSAGPKRGGGSMFLARYTLAFSCTTQSDCGVGSALICAGGFCTTRCGSDGDHDCNEVLGECITDLNKQTVCLISCDGYSSRNCPPNTYCGVIEGSTVCLPMSGNTCSLGELDSCGVFPDIPNYITCLPDDRPTHDGLCRSADDTGRACSDTSPCAATSYCDGGTCSRIPDLRLNGTGNLVPVTYKSENSDGEAVSCSFNGVENLMMYDDNHWQCFCPEGTLLYGMRCINTFIAESKTHMIEVCSSVGDCDDGMTCMGSRCLLRCNDFCIDYRLSCVQGVCQPRCTSDSQCPNEVICDHGSCRVKCTVNSIEQQQRCGAYHTCVDGYCVLYPIIQQETCEERGLLNLPLEEICQHKCNHDNECPRNLICVAGVCSVTCHVNNPTCPDGRFCLGGVCMIPCDASSQPCPLPDRQTCVNNVCMQQCTMTTGTNEIASSCPRFTTCTAGLYCFPKCSESSDCGGGQVCNQGICSPPCSSQHLCNSVFMCNTDKCFQKCSANNPCPEHLSCNYICRSAVGSSCQTNEDCGELNTLYCDTDMNGGSCHHINKVDCPCTYPNCGLNEVCGTDGTCSMRDQWNGTDLSHPDGVFPDTSYTSHVGLLNEKCTFDMQCQWYMRDFAKCISNHCYYTVFAISFLGTMGIEVDEDYDGAVDDPLPQRLVPSDGVFMLSCGESSQCDSNQICVHGACAAKCFSDKDCTNFQICHIGICMEFCRTNDDLCFASGDSCMDGICRDICEPGDITPYGRCLDNIVTIFCLSESDCLRNNDVCEASHCQLLCDSDTDCSEGQSCVLSMCTSSCTEEAADCIGGFRANLCYSDLDCGWERICVEGVCSPKCDCSKEQSSDCEAPQCTEEAGWMCSSDYRGCVHQDNVIKDDRSGSAGPELGTGGGAGGVIVTSCEDSLDCPHSNFYCHQELKDCRPTLLIIDGIKCLPESHPSYCGSNSECVDGVCDCLRGDSGGCVAYPPQTCTQGHDGQCADDQTCPYDWCKVPPIEIEEEPVYIDECLCYVDFSCECVGGDSGTCVECTHRSCENVGPGSYCDLEEDVCRCQEEYQALGDRCVQPILDKCTTNCTQGYECKNHRCYQQCEHSGNNTCPAGMICINGYCDYSCSSNTECGWGQRCAGGVCMWSCQVDEACLYGQICHTDSICRETCSSVNIHLQIYFACSYGGYSCIEGVCLPPISTLTHMYNVPCPPSEDQPDGYTLVEIDEATECDHLVRNTVCGADLQCQCEEGLTFYAGAVCQAMLHGCDSDDECMGSKERCIDGYCHVIHCNQSGCHGHTTCVDDVCVLPCEEDNQCLNHQTCDKVNGGCTTAAGEARDPPCSGCNDCGGDSVLTEMCKDGICRCVQGMRRSADTFQCEWLTDLVCLQCPPCSGDGASCGRKSMICVSGPRMCICDDGYQMDSAGEQCVVNNGVIIPQECAQERDCSFIPNSHCNNALGCSLASELALVCCCMEAHQRQCVCDPGWCYSDKGFCQTDRNECSGVYCAEGLVCVNLFCRISEPTCIASNFLDTRTSFNISCKNTQTCFEEVGNHSYCYDGLCSCVSGSAIVDGGCKMIKTCTRDADCDTGHSCSFGVCADGYSMEDLRLNSEKASADNMPKPESMIIPLLALVILFGITLVVFRRHNQGSKSQQEEQDKENAEKEALLNEKKMKLEARKSTFSEAQREAGKDEEGAKAKNSLTLPIPVATSKSAKSTKSTQSSKSAKVKPAKEEK